VLGGRVGEDVVDHRAQHGGPRGRELQPRRELGLTARPLHEHDQVARGVASQCRAVVALHQREGEVHSRGHSGGREDALVLDEQGVGLDLHIGERTRQHVGVAPVRRRAAFLQQAGSGQHECTGADRDDPAAVLRERRR
jgi:hypothetical protein